jgi:hypothetical protein
MRKTWLLVAVALLGGCTTEAQVHSLSGTQNTATLNRQAGVYVSVPADGQYEATSYPGSGQTTAQVLAAAFSKFAPTVHTAENASTNDATFAEAGKLGAAYVVIPVITHWEQRATAWSGIPSKMALRLTVFDTASRKEITSTSIESRSAIMTLLPTSPEGLLKDPVDKYVAGLYR